jgi:hypothetical protein
MTPRDWLVLAALGTVAVPAAIWISTLGFLIQLATFPLFLVVGYGVGRYFPQ